MGSAYKTSDSAVSPVRYFQSLLAPAKDMLTAYLGFFILALSTLSDVSAEEAPVSLDLDTTAGAAAAAKVEELKERQIMCPIGRKGRRCRRKLGLGVVEVEERQSMCPRLRRKKGR